MWISPSLVKITVWWGRPARQSAITLQTGHVQGIVEVPKRAADSAWSRELSPWQKTTLSREGFLEQVTPHFKISILLSGLQDTAYFRRGAARTKTKKSRGVMKHGTVWKFKVLIVQYVWNGGDLGTWEMKEGWQSGAVSLRILGCCC